MPRIAGNDIPDHKKVYYSLQSIFGVGPKIATDIVTEARLDGNKRARELTGEEIGRIQRVLEKNTVEGNLRRLLRENVERLKRIRSYRGLRHIAGLTVRGQRTKSNGRTVRRLKGSGKRRTVGSMTKEMASKLETAKKN